MKSDREDIYVANAKPPFPIAVVNPEGEEMTHQVKVKKLVKNLEKMLVSLLRQEDRPGVLQGHNKMYKCLY